MVTASPMLSFLDQPRADRFFQYFWAGQTDLSLQEWIIQFRRPGFTVGDFNGDGKLDVIVVTNGYTITGSILLGNGDGSLQPPVPLNQNIGSGYSTAASGDFNGDGKLDLLLLTPDFGTGATMAILFGNGDGTFQAPLTYSVPVAPYLALGDFNGDGKPDIAISGSGEVSILINNGDGTFKIPANYSISGNVQALTTADVDGDGKLDLVVPTGELPRASPCCAEMETEPLVIPSFILAISSAFTRLRSPWPISTVTANLTLH